MSSLFFHAVQTQSHYQILVCKLYSCKASVSASTVARLKQVWAKEYQQWNVCDLYKDKWVYIWADGIYSGLRAEQTKLCALVILGVNERGEKHFLAIEVAFVNRPRVLAVSLAKVQIS